MIVVYVIVVGSFVGLAAICSVVLGEWWPVVAAVTFVFAGTAMIAALLFVPPFVVWIRGYRNTDGLWRDTKQSDWKTAFAPRNHIERVLTYSVMSQVIPKPPTAVYEWLGPDARRVFTGIEQASRREAGGRFRVSDQLTDIKAADIRDFDTLLGYFEVASIDAAIYAVKEDMPIDYAKAMFP